MTQEEIMKIAAMAEGIRKLEIAIKRSSQEREALLDIVFLFCDCVTRIASNTQRGTPMEDAIATIEGAKIIASDEFPI